MDKTAAPPNPRPNPYVGPRSFETGELLYGLDTETRDLVSLLCAERIVLLHSPSGAGKTSLIQAALVPRMVERRFHVRPIARVNREPGQALRGDDFNRYIFSLLSSFEGAFPEQDQIPEEELASLTLAGYLARRPKPAGVSFELFIFDQFEEVITLNPADQASKHAFFTQLGRLLTDETCWVLFSIREDFLGALDPFLKYIPDRLATTYRLDLLGVKAAAQALQRPAASVQVTFEDAAVDQLLNDLRQVQVQRPDGQTEVQPGPYVEPVQLQVVAYRLWASLGPDDCQIGLDDLAALGDVGQALGAYYAQQVKRIASQTGLSERGIREWFDRRLISEGSLRSQVRMGAETSEGLANAAVHLLEDAHLIRAEKRGGATWYELAHDRLIQPVHSNNAAWFARHLSLLQRQAELWDAQRRPEGLLLRDKELSQAEGWAKKHSLLPAEQDFLEACRKARQQAERERRQSRRLRILAIAAGVAALAALVFGIWAGLSQQTAVRAEMEAVEQRDQARVSQLAAQGLAYQSRQLDLALLFSAEAYQLQDNYRTRDSLLNNLQYSPGLLAILHGHNDTVTNLAFSMDGKTLTSFSNNITTGGNDASVIRWDAITHRPLGDPVRLDSPGITFGPDFSPDNQVIAAGTYYDNNSVILWEVGSGQPLGNPFLVDDDNAVTQVTFSPDGQTIAAIKYDGSIILWDTASGQQKGDPLRADEYGFHALDFSPDSTTLAATTSDTVILWDVATGQQKGDPVTVDSYYSAMRLAFSPDGQMLATGFGDGEIILLDITTGQPPVNPLRGHTDAISSLAFSPDGRILASGSEDNTIKLWDVGAGQPWGDPLRGHTGAVYSLAFSPDSQTLASGSSDNTILLWEVAARQAVGNKFGDWNYVSAAISPDGQVLATGSLDNQVVLWEVATRQPLGEPLNGHTDDIYSVAFSPDGKILASGNWNEIILWDVATRQLLGSPLTKHAEGSTNWIFQPTGIAFSPDGTILAASSKDHGIILWDLATLQPLGDSLRGHTDVVNSLAFSPDGQFLASGSFDSTIILWDVASRQPLGEPVIADGVYSLSFSPDGQTLASTSKNNSIILWDLATRQPLVDPLKGHTDSVTSVAFSPVGQMIATGSYDNTIILWDAATYQPLGKPLKGHINFLQSIAFSKEGNMLVSNGSDGAVIVWDTNPAAWLERACRIANRNLTEEEWISLIGPDVPYHKTCPQNP
jgi:WD40 repeat protein